MIFVDIFSRTTWWILFIRYLHCTYIYGALTVFCHSHYGYCKSFCMFDCIIPYMLDVVVRGMITPPDQIAFTNTNTISGVLYISDTLLWCLVVNSSGKTVSTRLYPKMMRNVHTLLCYYIWTLYYIRTSWIMWIVWVQIYSDYHLNYIHMYYCFFWLFVFCYVIMYAIICVL